MNEFLRKLKSLINPLVIFFLIFLIFLMIDNIIGKQLLGNTIYNSYELQVEAWFNGHTYLSHDYPYLELAIYNGHYYVSFPPFPSVLLVPFYIIFSHDIPTNFISFLLFSFEFFIIYKMLKKEKNSETSAVFLASAITIGSNLLSLSVDSGVWFFAQLLNNFLCVLAIFAFVNNRKTLVFFFLALAVGCRPFSAVYILMFLVYYMFKEKDKAFFTRVLDNCIALIPTIVVAIVFMMYNYVRFSNPLEFGHNYLPEFVNSVDGQFSINYLWYNLKSFLYGGIHVTNDLKVSFDMPFACYIANPILLVYMYRSIKNVIKKKINPFRLLLFISIVINIILICLHKTLGGWQFGARYACDFLPFALLGIIWFKDSKGKIKKVKLNLFEIGCIIFGIILNIYGVIIFYR